MRGHCPQEASGKRLWTEKTKGPRQGLCVMGLSGRAVEGGKGAPEKCGTSSPQNLILARPADGPGFAASAREGPPGWLSLSAALQGTDR